MTRTGVWNRFKHDITHRGISAWVLSVLLVAFYIALYFTEGLTPLAAKLGLGSKWVLYGLLYTIAVVWGGVYMIRKHRHDRYQVIRTGVLMFVQVVFAFAIPHILKFFQQPEYYLSYFWPLKVDYFTPGYIFHLPLPFILYGFIGSLILVPLLGLFFGKRWYCSWVCGWGGLANTFGDPWRRLSDKSSTSWRFEKITVYSVLGICFLLTALLFISWGIGNKNPQLAQFTQKFQSAYGLVVVAILSGAVGIGLYPLAGTRVWCRFFCPMAALLGLIQKAGRFRVTVKPDMCISCGLCSEYCEMGIDVRSYAQANQSFTRAACVGCGICASICPRGVLRLENVRRRDPQERLVQISGI